MRTGKLDTRIQFFRPVETKLAGELKETYQAVTPKDWARLLTPRGNEAFESARLADRETIRILVRYRSDVISTWQVDLNGRRYNIDAVDDSMRRKGELWLTISTKKAR